MSDDNLWAVVLAGGIGSRFWPLSTPARPKQLLPLASERPLLHDTLERLRPLVPAARTLVLTSEALLDAVRGTIPAANEACIVAEPRAAGTAAALAFAATHIRRAGGEDAVMICVHADWAIGDPDAFRTTLTGAASAALAEHALVTVGVVPTRPDPGFGYIEAGDAVPHAADTPALHRVRRFVEKPDRARAAEMVAQGYLWNSGIFVWRAADYLSEVARLTPEVAPALDRADGTPGERENFFAAVTAPVSVDVGVLERSNRVLVVPGDFGWDDVGTWAALRRVRANDAGGNVSSGAVHAVDARGNVAYADSGTIVLYGVSDLVVVARDGVTLVTTVDRAADLKTLLDTLPASLRER